MNFSVKKEAKGRESIGEAIIGVDSKLRALEGTARILSENYGVQVVFSDDGECKTSRERMTLPYDEAVDEALIFGLMGCSGPIVSRDTIAKNAKLLEHPVRLLVPKCDNPKDRDNQQLTQETELFRDYTHSIFQR